MTRTGHEPVVIATTPMQGGVAHLREVLSRSNRAASPHDVVGEMALPDGMRMPVPRLAPAPPSRTATGRIEAMPQYAGQGARMVRRRAPAAEIVRELAEGAEALLARRL